MTDNGNVDMLADVLAPGPTVTWYLNDQQADTPLDRRKFARIVCYRPNPAKLKDNQLRHKCTCKRRTFSSIFGSAPPPPSPFQNTRSAVSLDSKFYFSPSAQQILKRCKRGTNLTVDDALVNVPNGSLSHVGVCDREGVCDGESALVCIGYTLHC